MGNIIKRNTTKMTIRVVGNGNIDKNTIITLQKDYDGWHGGGYAWCMAHLRNENFVEILEQK